MEAVKTGRQAEPLIFTHHSVGIDCFQPCTGGNQCCTGLLPVRKILAADHHLEMILVLFQNRFCRCKVGSQSCDPFLCRGDLYWIGSGNIRLQTVFGTGMVGLHQLELTDLDIQIHLFLDIWVSSCERLDLRIRKCGIIDILTRTNR